MNDLFPSDVSVRLRGDRDIAQTHLGAVRRMVFTALNTGLNPIKLIQFFQDGSTAHLLFTGKQKIVTIVSPPPPEDEVPPEEKPVEKLIKGPRPSVMLSGWMRLVTDDYRPSPANQVAYEYEDIWQVVPKLSYGNTRAPSAYSGAMKRVVQAVNGLGRHINEEPDYFTRDVTTGVRVATANYGFTAQTVDGIYKAGEKNHWVVRISGIYGVIAMPLLLLPGTMTAGFRARMVRIGDTDAVKVLDEFGGIPTGQGFPGELEIEGYIASGHLVRLMDLVDYQVWLDDGVNVKSPTSSWAFSEEDGHYQPLWHLGDRIADDTIPKFQIWGEWWSMQFTLTEHDIDAPNLDTPAPCGTGTVELLQMQHRGKIGMDCFNALYEGLGNGNIAPRYPYGGYSMTYGDVGGAFGDGPFPYIAPAGTLSGSVSSGISPDALNSSMGWGATIYAFYAGDTLMRLKWLPALRAYTAITGVDFRSNPGFYMDGVTEAHEVILLKSTREGFATSLRSSGGLFGKLLVWAVGMGHVRLTARNSGFMIGLVTVSQYDMRFDIQVSARGTQWFMDSTWYSPSGSQLAPEEFREAANNYPKLETIRHELPTGFEDTIVGQMTWVGAPD